jgi:hypothetical protein
MLNFNDSFILFCSNSKIPNIVSKGIIYISPDSSHFIKKQEIDHIRLLILLFDINTKRIIGCFRIKKHDYIPSKDSNGIINFVYKCCIENFTSLMSIDAIPFCQLVGTRGVHKFLNQDQTKTIFHMFTLLFMQKQFGVPISFSPPLQFYNLPSTRPIPKKSYHDEKEEDDDNQKWLTSICDQRFQ